MLVHDIGPQHLRNFSIIERLASSLSLIGICFILVTYGTSTAFHKPINRLVFFASLGNTFTNIATLISRDALTHSEGSLCKTQGFLIQMFMPADAYWTFAMACNVYLTFYHKFGAYQLRRLEKWYFLFCYGLPSIPAFVFLGVNTKGRGPMYGNATLWCWLSTKWDTFRIFVFYMPVWVVIVLTLAIYTRAGRDIWVKRKQLRNFVPSPLPPPQQMPTTPQALFTGKGIQQTTQISVNYESASPTDSVSQLTQKNAPEIQYPSPSAKPENSFTVNISSIPQDEPSPSRWSYAEKNYERKGSVAASVVPVTTRGHHAGPPRQYTANEANTAIWSYTKVSLLFFVAMMVTWIPSSANRVYSAVHKDQVSLPLEYASALVLPLQGFWNAVIYVTTSLQACKELWSNIRHRKITSTGRARTPNPLTHYVEDDREHHGAERLSSAHASPRSGGKQSFYVDTSSETELQIRPGTKDSTTT